MKLNMLIDFATDLGKTSKLVKVLRENGFSPQLLLYDIVRLKMEYHLIKSNVESVLNSVRNLNVLVVSWKNLWKVVCLEVWVEGEGKGVQNTLLEISDICVHSRHGKGGTVIKKLAWVKPCKWVSGGPIPESITRKCTDSVESLDSVFNQVNKLITVLLTTA